jgi:hypothetical protein
MKLTHACWLGAAAIVCSSGRLLAQSFGIEPPSLAMEIQGASIKGVPSQLTWAPDNASLSLQTLEGNSAPLKAHYYLIRLSDHHLQGADAPPEWAGSYWDWKSSRTPPGHPEFVIQVESQHQAGGIPFQSLHDKAANRGIDNAVAAQGAAAGALVRVLTLNGEAIGRYVDQPLVPGTTFGWSPERLRGVAFVKADGRLGLMDIEGAKVPIETDKGVLLPAWSPDGTRIVYLQKKGRRDYELMQVVVLHL